MRPSAINLGSSCSALPSDGGMGSPGGAPPMGGGGIRWFCAMSCWKRMF